MSDQLELEVGRVSAGNLKRGKKFKLQWMSEIRMIEIWKDTSLDFRQQFVSEIRTEKLSKIWTSRLGCLQY